MKRSITAVAVGATLLTALTCGAAAAEPRPADAWIRQNVSGSWACPDGYICLYENYQANKGSPGWMLALKGSIEHLDWYNFNDRTSSVVNRSNNTAILYGDYNFGGPSATIRPGTKYSFENNVPMNNDWTSSVRVRLGDTGDDWVDDSWG